MVIRRLVAVAAAAGALLLGLAGPALADDDLQVTVAGVAPGQVRLTAQLPGRPGAEPPRITVTRDGYRLPASVRPAGPTSAPAAAGSVVVVLDTGSEMAGSPIRAAREGLLDLAGVLPAGTTIGLVTAGGDADVAVQPTVDRSQFRAAVSDVRTAGESVVGAGLSAAAGLGADRILVVAQGSGADDAAVGDGLRDGVRVDLITVGGSTEGLGGIREVVAATGGTARPADEPAQLPALLRAAVPDSSREVLITVGIPPALAGTTETLTVTAGQGSGRLRSDVRVEFAPPAATSSPASADRFALFSTLTPSTSVLGLLVFGALLVATLLVAFGLGGSVRDHRLKQVERFRLAGPGIRTSGQGVAVPSGTSFAQTIRSLSERAVTSGGGEERLAGKLDRAGLTMRPHEWAAWRAGTSVAGAVLLGLAGGLLGALLGAGLGWLAAGLFRRLRESRRKQAFADQLPDALQLIVGSLRSGFSLAQSIDAVVRDAPAGPLAVELGRAMAEVRLGSDLDEALERTAQRVDNEDLAWAVMAIRIQRDTGGNLAEVLETTVETIRERERLRRHVKALSAEGRLSAYILIGLPFVLAAWLMVVRWEYLSVLWTTPLGLLLLVGGGILIAVGSFWMARWIRVEV